MAEKIQKHVKEFTRKIKGNTKVEHTRREPGSGVSFSKSNTARAMQGGMHKIHNIAVIREQPLSIPTHSANVFLKNEQADEPEGVQTVSETSKRHQIF